MDFINQIIKNGNGFPAIIIGFIIIGFVGTIVFKIYQHMHWENLPERSEYSQNNRDCKTKNGMKCNNCGSRSIKNWGVKGANDRRRKFICNHCGADLYRQ